MKLLEIRLEDFRQFSGSQKITVSHDDDKNVTLIHAENGFGKTTLLNALLWCFYEVTTGKFEGKDRLVNFEAIRSGKKTAFVEVQFEHEGDVFLARREAHDGSRRAPLTVFSITHGNHEELPNPDTLINSVIPRSMAPYFFFDGEQAEAFSGERNNRVVGDAIQTMLGCDVAQTAISDLDYLSRKFDEEIGRLPGKKEIQDEEATLSQLQQRKDALVASRRSLTERRDLLEAEVERLDIDLRNIQEAAELQRQREECETKLKDAIDRKRTLDHRRTRWLISRAVPIVGIKLADTVAATLESNDLSGIPSPYNEEFVNSLLSKGECICSRPLSEGTHEYGCVASLLSDAPSKIIQRQAIQAKSAAAHIQRLRHEDWPELKDIDRDRLINQNEIADLEVKIRELSEKLRDHSLDKIREKEHARRSASTGKQKISEQLGALGVNVDRCEEDIAASKQKIDRLVQGDSAAKPLLDRRNLCDAAINELRQALDNYKEDARRQISGRVNDILSETAHKDFEARIGEDFHLTLLSGDGTETPKSGGENQLLSLAFIAALVRFSADRQQGDDEKILVPGTVAPLMLDSPFGQLDPTYRSAVASFVPAMATQVILLVSSAQGSSDVVDKLRNRIGEEYQLDWDQRDTHRTLIKRLSL